MIEYMIEPINKGTADDRNVKQAIVKEVFLMKIKRNYMRGVNNSRTSIDVISFKLNKSAVKLLPFKHLRCIYFCNENSTTAQVHKQSLRS